MSGPGVSDRDQSRQPAGGEGGCGGTVDRGAAGRPGKGAGPQAGYAVQARDLTRRFGAFTAVDSINLEVRAGEIFGFLGANGAGKTTAIRMFCGLLKPSAGEAWIDGLPISTATERIKRRIGYMSQKFSLYDDLTVEENITLSGGIRGLGRNAIKKLGNELVERLGLEEYRSRLTASVPLGFKQRLALGCSVLHSPSVVFLDEPTGGVDPVARRQFWDLIYELAEGGTTIFVTTHYMDEAEYCNRVSIMVGGRIAALDSPEGLKRLTGSETMQDVFISVVKP